MYCTKCGHQMRIAPEQHGVDNKGYPLYHRFAYCDNCKIKQDLDYEPQQQDMGNRRMNVLPQTGTYFDTSNKSKNKNTRYKKIAKYTASVIAMAFVIGMLISNYFSDSTISTNESNKNVNVNKEHNKAKEKSKKIEHETDNEGENIFLEDGLKKYNGGKYSYITPEDLDTYAPNLTGVKIYTVINVDEIEDDAIKSVITDGYMYSNFDCGDRIKGYRNKIKEDETVAILGNVIGLDNYSFMGNSVRLEKCYVFAVGKDAEKYKKKKSDKSLNEYLTVTVDVANNGADISEDEYKKLCESLNYENILRDPDSNDGKYCKVSGTVDQIVEGWFDSYTIYIKDYSGNKWGCVYNYKDNESHLLEGDDVTLYGKCKGTTTVKNVLGKQVTLPEVDVEYIK